MDPIHAWYDRYGKMSLQLGSVDRGTRRTIQFKLNLHWCQQRDYMYKHVSSPHIAIEFNPSPLLRISPWMWHIGLPTLKPAPLIWLRDHCLAWVGWRLTCRSSHKFTRLAVYLECYVVTHQVSDIESYRKFFQPLSILQTMMKLSETFTKIARHSTIFWMKRKLQRILRSKWWQWSRILLKDLIITNPKSHICGLCFWVRLQNLALAWPQVLPSTNRSRKVSNLNQHGRHL